MKRITGLALFGVFALLDMVVGQAEDNSGRLYSSRYVARSVFVQIYINNPNDALDQ